MLNFSQDVDNQTLESHQRSTESVIIKAYLKGTITLQLHAEYLLQSYFVFSRIETMMIDHKEHPIFNAGLYDLLHSLKRQDALKKDYEYACRRLNQPTTLDAKKIWPQTQKILNDIADSKNNSESFLAHAYVQYRALLNGGTVLKAKSQRLLDSKESEGVTLYTFPDRAFVIDKAVTDKIDAAAEQKHLSLETFVPKVKQIYELVINQSNQKKSHCCETFSNNLHQFWQQKAKTAIPILGTVLATAVATYVYTK